MNQSHNSATPKIIGAIVASAILLIGIYTLVINKPKDEESSSLSTTSQSTASPSLSTDSQPTQQSTTSQQDPSASTTTATSTYKDGTYTKSVNYSVPEGGTNQLTAEVTIVNGVITNVTPSAKYEDRESTKYINGFNGSINNSVKGKQLSDAFVGRIGGASLTSNAFNDIIDAIRAEAKA